MSHPLPPSSGNQSSPVVTRSAPTGTEKSLPPSSKAAFSGRSVQAEAEVANKLPTPPKTEKRRFKALRQFFSIKPTPPRYHFNARIQAGNQTFQVRTNDRNLNVFTNVPNTRVYGNVPNTQIHHFQGNPLQIQVPQLGTFNLQPLPTLPTPFVFAPGFNPFPTNQPPVQQTFVPASSQRHSHRSTRSASKVPVLNHIYQDQAARLKTKNMRVTDRFHTTDQSIKKLQSHSSESLQRSFKLSGNKAIANQMKASDYGKLSQVMKQHTDSMTNKVPITKEQVEARGQAFVRNLESGMKTIDNIFKTGRQHFSHDEKASLWALRGQMDNERSLMLQVMDDKGASHLSHQMDWQTASDFKRVGYDLSPTLLTHMTPLDNSRIESEEPFGAGQAHSVVKLTYKGSGGEKAQQRIFKAEDATDRSRFEQTVSKGQYLDKRRPKFAVRNLAAQNLQKELGLDLLPEMKLSTHKGKVGLLMEEAKGLQPFNPKTGKANKIPFDDKSKPDISAKIQKNLINAEWLDCLTGQQDRHTSNYFINPENGKVTLIDNDQSFYPGLDTVAKADPTRKLGSWTAPWPGPPAVIDRQLYNKISTMGEDDIQSQLAGLLSAKEIEATVSRFKQLKSHAEQLYKEGKVIDNWSDWKDSTPPPLKMADFLRLKGSSQSYFNTAEKLHRNPGLSLQTPKPMSEPKTPRSTR